MGRKDDKTDEYFSDNVRFADLWNAVVFGGERVIEASELSDMNTVVRSDTKRGSRKVITDHTKLWRGKHLRILIEENQTYIDYGMVIRNMLTESIMYDKQRKEYKKKHKIARDFSNEDEYLSGMTKADTLTPVITLVINLSSKRWDAARELRELFEADGDVRLDKLITNYKLNIFDYHDYNDFEAFKTELRQVFELLRYADDEENMTSVIDSSREAYSRLDEESAALVEELMNIKVEESGGCVNMSKAWDDHFESGRKQGLSQGLEQGLSQGLSQGLIQGVAQGLDQAICSMVIKKVKKNMPLDVIARELEEDEIVIEPIYKCVIANPGKDEKEICDLLQAEG